MDWTGIAKTVGTTGVVVFAIGYFLRQVFQQVLSRDLEKFKADLSARHDIEIERLRKDLRIAASEHETRFTRLHETRLQKIAELYRLLARAHRAFGDYLTTVQPGGAPDPKDAKERGTEFVEYFSENRIYFEESLCRDIDAADDEFMRALSEMEGYPPRMPGRPGKWLETWKGFKDRFPPLRMKIEEHFRELLGVQGPQSNSQRTGDKAPLPQGHNL